MSIRLVYANRRVELAKKQQLSYWDLCYLENRKNLFYPSSIKKSQIELTSMLEFNELKTFAKPENFVITIDNNPEFEKRYGNLNNFDLDEKEKAFLKQVHLDLANKYIKYNYKDYTRVLNILEEGNYDNTFKCLILKEYLTQKYIILNTHNNLIETQSRNINNSFRGLMYLDKFIIDYIYNIAPVYNNFKNLYFDAICYSKKHIVQQQEQINQKIKKHIIFNKKTDLLNYDTTFNDLGHWVKFASFYADKENFQSSAENLANLVQGTNSCLIFNAERYLKDDAIYLFVDKNYIPRIRVLCLNNNIQEVRGLAKGQNVEEKYIDVAIEFLKNNKNMPNSKFFIDYLQNNKEIISITKQLTEGSAQPSDFKNLDACLEFSDKIFFEGENEFAQNLKTVLNNQVLEK